VIVDAIFGTGLMRAVSGELASIIAAVNGAGHPIVAVDIPSGLNADTGAVLGIATRAALTVTFIGRKLGCYLGAGPEHVGRLEFDDLAVPPETHATQLPAARLLGEADVVAALRAAATARTRVTTGTCWWWAAAPGCRARCAWPARPRCVRGRAWSPRPCTPTTHASWPRGRNSCALPRARRPTSLRR